MCNYLILTIKIIIIKKINIKYNKRIKMLIFQYKFNIKTKFKLLNYDLINKLSRKFKNQPRNIKSRSS